ncbi:MAG: low specificity L-threonine aldolase [Magnetovibrio sp.]|nr:low specificity L-threonine aldolase [Magnetovibrio sp.]|tara:strand:+ start:714 stop:1754 length:1041 start_codon:yes stop_codon:yes gene_type:complete
MNSAIKIDLYSDTHTVPSAAMRQAIAEAEVGDEQQEADPTTNHLQEMVANLLGKERALLLPSGTMCNVIAYRLWCNPGDEVICDKTAHTIHSETGGPAALAGAMMRIVDGTRGIFSAEELSGALRPNKRNAPKSRMLSIENTSNAGGGSVWPLQTVKAVCDAAHEANLICHMDGARLLNAVVASQTPASDYAEYLDSIWIDLSKGLGCPIGAVLAGSNDFIEEAFRLKHLLGGAMRQSGIIAAAGIYALKHNVDRLAEDHENAKRLARRLAQIPGINIDVSDVETNLVFFDTTSTGRTASEISEALRVEGVFIGAVNETRMRAVTHLNISASMVDTAADTIAKVLN